MKFLFAGPVLRDKDRVHARFLLGPAGAGKTFRCLAEIRQSLLAEPDGPPLILLAPKQTTYQLERQLLADTTLQGYTRLQILSFERLAKFVLAWIGEPEPALLSEDGRIMVLHALLARRRKELQIFHASAGLPGFARQLSLELRKLQQRQISPEILRQLAAQTDLSEGLRRKLHDLSVLLADYLEWLQRRSLQDAECLLDLATSTLKRAESSETQFSTLWLDGFAEMTTSEMDLLAAVAACCDKVTLAFCLPAPPPQTPGSWLSIWTGIGETFRQCVARLSGLPGARVSVDVLERDAARSRFSANPVLRHLEEKWMQPSDFLNDSGVTVSDSLRLAECLNPAMETVLAAREILKFVRAGGRFREAAVLLRQMDGYHDHLRRVFSRYEIPFFLDRRRPVAHHPLAELTRSALRAAAFGWQHDDWFAALKTGLVAAEEEEIDRLENEALARGWKGEAWFAPLPTDNANSDWAERLRRKWIGPYANFRNVLSAQQFRVDGPQLIQAVRQLWRDLNVEKTLQDWSLAEDPNRAVHDTIWHQMNQWLDDMALAFTGDAMALRDWLPILEAGLAQLSVGVIPPVLDQVLIGSIDRSRNPELKLAVLLGVNETVFPATPPQGHLLGEADREELAAQEIHLGNGRREFLSRERFLGYIACTRARERLVVTCARQDNDGGALNPSPFFAHLNRLFSKVPVEQFEQPDWREAEHLIELAGQLARVGNRAPVLSELLQRPAFASLREQMASFACVTEALALKPEQAAQLYGAALRTSVSRLEDFAACSFKFFVRSGLRAEERQRYELDVRERGSFQHEVLARFHKALQRENKKWRDITPAEARLRVRQSVAEVLPQFREGLLEASAPARFAARTVTESLQDFVAATVEWMAQYEFDPCAVEVGFGMENGPLPAWEIDLGAGRRLIFRGVIDRVDLCRAGREDEALAVVVDYKSSARKMDKIMMAHGLHLQLPAYLGVLRHLGDARKAFGVGRLLPAGVFYVNLRGQFERGDSRQEILPQREEFRQKRYQHSGRFDLTALPYLDDRQASEGTQFKYKLNANGEPDARNTDLMRPEAFAEMLDHVEAELVRMGGEIYGGAIGLNPFQKGSERACDKCQYQGICRIDPWVNSFRVLR
ncbi:MAG TPA: PD-(D/E)XK nuclease family protein [Verrucomicrobiae bacterium]|nr:PD-(D/E)XK nuclease family protein [Verrucomicrobiae bacterium]